MSWWTKPNPLKILRLRESKSNYLGECPRGIASHETTVEMSSKFLGQVIRIRKWTPRIRMSVCMSLRTGYNVNSVKIIILESVTKRLKGVSSVVQMITLLETIQNNRKVTSSSCGPYLSASWCSWSRKK